MKEDLFFVLVKILLVKIDLVNIDMVKIAFKESFFLSPLNSIFYLHYAENTPPRHRLLIRFSSLFENTSKLQYSRNMLRI